MSLSEQITGLRTMLDNAESEIRSLEGGRKASSARARKSLQNIKTTCHGLRKSVTEHTKTLPTKPRVKREILCPSHVAVEAEAVEVAPVEELTPSPPKLKRARAKKVAKED